MNLIAQALDAPNKEIKPAPTDDLVAEFLIGTAILFVILVVGILISRRR